MLLSNAAKSFLTSGLLLFFFAGCSLWQNREGQNAPIISETKSRIPFPTKEPDNFQCEIIITSGGLERRILVARKGEMRRIVYNFGTPGQYGTLDIGKVYLIAASQMAYAEKPSDAKLFEGGTQFSDLTSELLNRRDHTEFEALGRENDLVKYRARINEGSASEILIYVDESIGMPIKQELFSVEGENRTLQYTMELKNFKLETDEGLFAIPAGFRKISLDEFYRTIR